MRFLSLILTVVMAFSLAGCSGKFKTYNGPEVTQILVYKADRKMYLMHNKDVLKSYDIALGFAPVGHKQFEGDGKTPEGTYRIDRRNPNSEFYLSVGMNFPTPRISPLPQVRARARAATSLSMASPIPRKRRCAATGRQAASLWRITRSKISTPWWATVRSSPSIPDPCSVRACNGAHRWNLRVKRG